MDQHYTSFLLRCWHVNGNERRIKIEHIQSREWTRVATLAEAMIWLADHLSAPAYDREEVPDLTGPEPPGIGEEPR